MSIPENVAPLKRLLIGEMQSSGFTSSQIICLILSMPDDQEIACFSSACSPAHCAQHLPVCKRDQAPVLFFAAMTFGMVLCCLHFHEWQALPIPALSVVQVAYVAMIPCMLFCKCAATLAEQPSLQLLGLPLVAMLQVPPCTHCCLGCSSPMRDL